MNDIKKCTSCSILKKFSEFPPAKRMVLGVDSHCKECRAKKRTSKLRDKNTEFFIKKEKFKTSLENHRICRVCCIEKDLSNFSFSKKDGSVYQYDCKDCASRYAKKRYIEKKSHISALGKIYYKNNKERYKKINEKSALKRYFGITPKCYEKMMIKCNNSCEICGRSSDILKKRLAVDHNHVTGVIRGALCMACNNAIGMLRADVGVELLQNAIDYIRRTEEINFL